MSSRRCRRRICAISCCGCRRAASSAPTSPSRTRSGVLAAVDARCARAGGRRRQHAVVRRRRAALDQHRRRRLSSAISMPARPAGTSAEEALVLGAGGSSRAVVFGLLERGIKRVHLANRTRDAGRGAGGAVRAKVHAAGLGAGIDDVAAAGRTSREHDLARHARPARARHRCGAAAARRRRRRSRLCAAGDAAACGRQGARAEDRRRARHAAASGGARLRAVVRPAARR